MLIQFLDFGLEDAVMLKLSVFWNFYQISSEHLLTIGLPWQQVESRVNKNAFSDLPCADKYRSLNVSSSYSKLF